METNIHGTTILSVRRNGITVIGGDGQMTMGNAVVKHTTEKVKFITNKTHPVHTQLDDHNPHKHEALHNQSVANSNNHEIDRQNTNKVLVGFAGSTADGVTLMERLELKLIKFSFNLSRACVELAKEWRTDKALRRLDALMITANKSRTFLLSGQGDVIEPSDDIIAIGSGGSFALSAAKALYESTNLEAKDIVEKSLKVAADICIYTNHNFTIKEIK